MLYEIEGIAKSPAANPLFNSNPKI